MHPFKLQKTKLTKKEFSSLFQTLIKELTRKECDIDSLDLSGLRISEEQMDKGIKKITERSLSENECAQLSDALRKNRSVKSLNLIDTSIMPAGLRQLANIFNENRHITKIELDSSGFREMIKKLEKTEASIKKLMNKIITEGPSQFPEFSFLELPHEKLMNLDKNVISAFIKNLDGSLKYINQEINVLRQRKSKLSKGGDNESLERINHQIERLQKASNFIVPQYTELLKLLTLREEQVKAVKKEQKEISQTKSLFTKGLERNREFEQSGKGAIVRSSERIERDKVDDIKRRKQEDVLKRSMEGYLERTQAAELKRRRDEEEREKSRLEAIKNQQEELRKREEELKNKENQDKKLKQSMDEYDKRKKRALFKQPIKDHRARKKEEKLEVSMKGYHERSAPEAGELYTSDEKTKFIKLQKEIIRDLKEYLDEKKIEIRMLQESQKQDKTAITSAGIDLLKKRNLVEKVLKKLQSQPINLLFPKGPDEIVKEFKSFAEEDKKIRMDSSNPYHMLFAGKLNDIFKKYEKSFTVKVAKQKPPQGDVR